MPPPRNASTYNARPPTREREELAKRCLERSKNALLEFQKKSAALGVAVAPMTAPDGTTVAYEHFDGVRVAPPVENAVIKLVEENAPSMPAPKPRLPLSPKNTATTSSWKTGFLEPKKTDARGRFVAPPPAPRTGHQAWAGSRRPVRRLLDRRGAGLEALTPAILSAHAICPGSGYDRLICDGEAVCDHGQAPKRKRA